jgi:endonuclease/exonuclease/phosphatase (EEP) superfamily protein YafD
MRIGTNSGSIQRRLRRLALAAIDVYAALTVLGLLLKALSGNRLWPIALFSTFLNWVLLPAFVLLPLVIWRRRWLTAVMASMGVAAFLWLFGELFLPRPLSFTDSRVVTVMTYNVADSLAPPDDLVAALRSSEADIIALQELGAEQAVAIEQDLTDLYPYQILYGYGIPGKGLLSRYPILREELFYLQARRLPHLRAAIAVNGESVPWTIIIAHPPPPGFDQSGYHVHPDAAAEIKTLAQMATAEGPGILMGDFNTTDQSDNYRLLTNEGLVDAFRAAGWGFGATWPAHRVDLLLCPVVRLDYIWSTAHFRAVRAWVDPRVGSDHLPVLAELVWQPQTQGAQ